MDALIGRARETIADYERFGGSIANATFYEVGAGRDLTFAIALRLLGVGRVVTVDLNRIASLPLIERSWAHVAERLGRKTTPPDSWEQLEAAGITYLAPFDSRMPMLDPHTIDCFCSNETLEHIPAADLLAILKATLPLMRPGALASHRIDYSDHFARDDAHISRFNFLKYSDAQWRWINPPLLYVNRLRHSDYLRIIDQAGWQLLQEERNSQPPVPEVWDKLAHQFKAYAPSDLFVQGSRLILKPKRDALVPRRSAGSIRFTPRRLAARSRQEQPKH